MRCPRTWRWTAPMAGLLLACAAPAHAALGRPADSIPADGTPTTQRALQATSAGVSAQSVVTPDGVLVTEYVSQGTVFAVTWRGPVMPDLNSLLADAFPSLRAWLAAHPAPPNRPIRMDTAQLVVHAGGHMRAFQGVAYLPAQVPPGFDITQLAN
ncbi:hypothetical protein GALL_314100 [mine drainage metagenome]|uniref:DUF2844 domain-containing protein n=1 Tax=mine drainage metagenome TaxID=410659 RepID=A0A1J5QTS1_9ZZZZ